VPRISAASIAEHVANQEVAVVDAARRLFAERGIAAVSLSDIAEEVGLKRTSLYRYFPTKSHILQRWFDQVMTPLVDQSRRIVEEENTPARRRLEAWLDLQLDFVTDESHVALVTAAEGVDDLPEEVRAGFGQRHRELYATLEPLLRSGGARTREATRARAVMIAGLVRSAGELVRAGMPAAGVRRELVRSAAAVAGL
jgi:AcrR family transcriptional regulator